MATRRSPRLPPRRRPRVVVASAARVKSSAREFTRRSQGWQEECWTYFDEIGEVKYAAGFYARMLSKLELYPAVRSADGQDVLRVTTPLYVDLLERIQDATGTRARLQARYGMHRFIVGESYLTCTIYETGEEWEMLSPQELTVNGDKTYTRDRGDGAGPLVFNEVPDGEAGSPGEMLVWRLWAPHARRSGEADSPLRGVREPCDRLLTLGRAIQARGRSRIAGAGILIVSQDVTTPGEANLPDDPGDGSSEPPAPAGDATETISDDPVLQAIADSMEAPIADRASAASVIPVMLRVPGDQVNAALTHVSLADAQGYPEAAQIDQEIRRIAMGLDMPAESLLGVGDMNHWSGWLVSREAWQSHGQPVAEELVADLTSAYYRGAVSDVADADLITVDVDRNGVAETLDVAPQDLFVWYDASAVVLNPDRARDTKDAHDRLLISDDAGRVGLGFNPQDAPTPEEWAARAALKTSRVTSRIDATGEQPSDVEPAPPAEPNQAAAELAGAMRLAAARSVEVAGARLRGRLQGNPEYKRRFERVPNRRLVAVCGRPLVETMFGQHAERALVAGAADDLLDSLNGNRAAVLAAIEQVALRHLYDTTGEPVLDAATLDLAARETRADAS